MHIRLPILVVFLLTAAPAAEAETIRVAIAENQRAVTVQSSSGLQIAGTAAARQEKKMVFTAGAAGTRPVRIQTPGAFIQVNGKSYRGVIEIRKKKNGSLLVINDLDLEEYLQGVIAEEIPADWEPEALRAQAVASRTYALYQKQNAGKRPFHIRATVSDQMYGGRSGERTAAIRAVRDTRGLVITYRGAVIPAFYHSSCGGHTENAAELWGIDAPYLQGVACDCQEISRYGLWEKRVGTAALAAALGRLGFRVKEISSLEIEDLTPAGRVRNVAVRHAQGRISVPAETLRGVIGYGAIPSVFFESETKEGEVIFSGRGRGHGVGLCQWGVREMAQRGYDFPAILRYYYPGTSLVRLESL